MIQAQNAALSALKAFSTRVNSNANNIANANTEGYKKTRVILSEADRQGVTTQVQKVETPGTVVYEAGESGYDPVELSNVDLAEEIPEMNLNSTMYKANLKTLQVADEMTASLLDIKA